MSSSLLIAVLILSQIPAVRAVQCLDHLLHPDTSAYYAQMQNPAPLIPPHVFVSSCEVMDAITAHTAGALAADEYWWGAPKL